MNIRKMVEERDKALLSLDKEAILAYARKYAPEFLMIADNETVFWASVHKARTACINLPNEARWLSKQWLAERGFKILPGAQDAAAPEGDE